jgi:hypothetical protein
MSDPDDEPNPIDRLISLYYLPGNAEVGILVDDESED